MILTLDCATHLGWASGPVGARPPLLQWGSRDFSARTNGEIIATFRAWLSEQCHRLQPTLIVYETPYIPVPSFRPVQKKNSAGPPPMNPLTLRRLLGITGVVDAIGFEFRIEVVETTTQEFSKFMTGKGRYPGATSNERRAAKKGAVIAACKRYGCDPHGDDNAADALGIWFYAEAIRSPRAAEARSRYAADVERKTKGIGGLFASAENANPPGADSKGVLLGNHSEGSIQRWVSSY